MICFPNCKINIGLHILHQREDGFHQIESVFYPLPLKDILEVLPQPKVKDKSKITMHTSGLTIEGADMADNLVAKAYHLLYNDYDLPPIEVHLHKAIPMGAGLGGGSADAAFMLRLLNDQFNLKLDAAQLKNYASKLGSDCAFFIDNKPAYLLGRGPELRSFDLNLEGWYLVILCPPYHSSTQMAYQYAMKRGAWNSDESILKNIELPVQHWREHIFNDFEQSVFKSIPELAHIKSRLYESGATYASMSGSGSSFFALFKEEIPMPKELSNFCKWKGYIKKTLL
jgi:4-diphosphocytidyl-2-C-methyl-D-erythritol kinase